MADLAMGRSVNDVRLRVWTPQAAEVVSLEQVAPGLEDLTDRRTDVDDLVGEYPTGAWGEETRDYHLRIRVPAARSASACSPVARCSWSTARPRPRATSSPNGPMTRS